MLHHQVSITYDAAKRAKDLLGMAWKVKQRNSVCCLHMWTPSVIQAHKHMYVFLLRIAREHTASNDCSALAACHKGAINRT